MTYRACPTKRSRRTKADISAIRTAIHNVIEDDPPMTVRQVFYQLVARGVIEKTEEQYQGTVIRLMTEMRLDGSLPYSWVVDESRRVRITKTYDSIQDALEQTAKFYRRSALAQASDYLEIWCEKDALAGVLWDVTSDYDVPLMVSRGMPSLTFLHASAQAIRNAAKAEGRARIKPEAGRVHAAYVEKNAQKIVERTGISKVAAVAQIESRCRGVLQAEDVLEFVDKKLEGCMVGDVLADPERFDGCVLADPIEGIPYGRTTAMVMLRRSDGHPWIKSFAHGGV